MNIQVGSHGGDTIVSVNASHNIAGIVPSLGTFKVNFNTYLDRFALIVKLNQSWIK